MHLLFLVLVTWFSVVKNKVRMAVLIVGFYCLKQILLLLGTKLSMSPVLVYHSVQIVAYSRCTGLRPTSGWALHSFYHTMNLFYLSRCVGSSLMFEYTL